MDDFQTVLGVQLRQFYGQTDIDEIESFVWETAVVLHTGGVLSALNHLIAQTAEIGTSTEQGMYYLRYGALRRLLMTFHAARNVQHIAAPDRTEPLEMEEGEDLTRDLNVIYMNVRGTLDNYAWALIHDKEPESAEKQNPTNVNLFAKVILQNETFAAIRDELQTHLDWSIDLKKKRDPVAHRIPLTAPPAALSPDEVADQKTLLAEYWQHLANQKYDESDKKMAQLNCLGTFQPFFLHHPDEPIMNIYPTVFEDLRHLVEIGICVINFVSNK